MTEQQIIEESNYWAIQFADADIDVRDAIKIGFQYAANWRINSVWHDVSKELPDIGKHVVNEDWFDFIADDEKDMERILRLYPFKHWAYIDDLLPDGKEDR